MGERRNSQILKLTQMALLTALVVVLQLFATGIKIGPLPMSFVLIPIVIGACLFGKASGAFLGFVFGLITMIAGISGADGFSYMLWTASPVLFVILCLLKATAAGFCAGLVYQVLGKVFGGKKKLLQTVLASVTAPVVNTGIFVVGMLLFFSDSAMELSSVLGYADVYSIVFLGLAGLNFVGEFAINLVVSPALVRIVDVVKNKLHI